MDSGDSDAGSGGSVGPAADTTAPKYINVSRTPDYPGPTTKVNMTAVVTDESSLTVKLRYGYDNKTWSNLSTTETKKEREQKDRNPSTGNTRGTLSKEYSLNGELVYLHVYIYSSDHDTCWLRVRGYKASSSSWENIYYSTSTGDGNKVRQNLKGKGYTKWDIRYYDTERNDNIHYNCTYRAMDTAYTGWVPAAGTKNKVYCYFNATDASNNYADSDVYSYDIDSTKPKVENFTDNINFTVKVGHSFDIYANLSDNNRIGSAYINWTTDNSTYHLDPMRKKSGTDKAAEWVGGMTPPSKNTTVYYRVDVYDEGMNHANSTLANLSWNPPPVISSIGYSPFYINNRTKVTVWATVTDADNVSAVWVKYSSKTIDWTRVNATQNGSNYSAVIPAIKGSSWVHFRYYANDTEGGVNNTTAHMYRIDEKVPTYAGSYVDTDIPGPKSYVNVTGFLSDDNEPLNTTLQYGFDNRTWKDLNATYTTGQMTYDDRNPDSGTVRGKTLSNTYDLKGVLAFLYVYVYSSDHDTLSIDIDGYNPTSGWKDIYSGSGDRDGTKVNKNLKSEGFSKWKISYRDTEGNDNIYYNCTYRVDLTGYAATIPPVGQNARVYYRFKATDLANNTVTTAGEYYDVDIKAPTFINNSLPTIVWRGISDLTVYCNVTDNVKLGPILFNWSTDNSTWSQVAMVKVSGTDTAAEYRSSLGYVSKNTTYYVQMFGYDVPGNEQKTSVFKVAWNPPPWIRVVSYLPQYPNNRTKVNITADAWDDDGVSQVYLKYNTGGTTWSKVDGIKQDASNWSAEVPAIKGVAWVNYVVYAVDKDSGENQTATLKYYIDEKYATVHTPFTEPYYPNATQPVWLLANITDNVGVTNATIWYKVGRAVVFTKADYKQESHRDSLTVAGYVRLDDSVYYAGLEVLGVRLGAWNASAGGRGDTPNATFWTDIDCLLLDGCGSTFNHTEAEAAARQGKFVVTNRYTWNSVRSLLGNPSYTSHKSHGFTTHGLTVGRGAVVYTSNLYNNNYLGYSYDRYNNATRDDLAAHLREVHGVFMAYSLKLAKTTTSKTITYKMSVTDYSNNTYYTSEMNFTTDGDLPKVSEAGGPPSPALLDRTKSHSVWANITDETYIGGANVVYSIDNGTNWMSRPLSKGSGNNTNATWSGSIPGPNVNCWVWYYYQVYDRADNYVRYPSSKDYSYRVTDVPAFANIAHSPDKANATSKITFTANVTDIDGVTGVLVAYSMGSGSESTINLTNVSADGWSATIDSPGVTGTLYYHLRATEKLGLSANSSQHSMGVDASAPSVNMTGWYPTYPNTTTDVQVNGTAVDQETAVTAYFDYKFGATGNVTSVNVGQGATITKNVRNPSSGTVRGQTLTGSYDGNGAELKTLNVYVYSSDHDTLWLRVRGYKESTNTWENIYYSTRTRDGTKVNTDLKGKGYTKWDIRYYDTENNDRIYYSATYTFSKTSFSTTVPAPGTSAMLYVRMRAVDEAYNANTTAWQQIWFDGMLPQLDSHKPIGVRDAFTDIKLSARFRDEHKMDRAQLWYSYEGGPWQYLNMTNTFDNGTHIGSAGEVEATGIPMFVEYFFVFWDGAGNNASSARYNYTTKVRNLQEGVFSYFDATKLWCPAGYKTYEWDFDYNGTFDADRTTKAPRYRWYDNGTYDVVLRLTDNGGNVTNRTFTVFVMDRGPSAIIQAVEEVTEGVQTVLDGSLSSSWPDAIVMYDWDIEYDGSFSADFSGMKINYTFLKNGATRIALRVTDDDGTQDETDFTIDVLDGRPSLLVVMPSEADEGTVVVFNANQTVSWPDAIDRFEWDLDHNGTFNVDRTGPKVNRTYMDDGEYEIKVKCFDSDGSEVSYVGTITINDLGPTAVINTTGRADEGAPLVFNGSQSMSYPDELTEHAWDFHYDGTFNAETTGEEVNFTYMDNGTYSVALRVTDDDGSYCVTSVEVRVEDLRPGGVIIGPQEVFEGSYFDLSAAASSFPDEIARFEWDYDYDGVSFVRDALGEDVRYVFMDNGTYQIAMRVWDDDGSVVMDVVSLTVKDLGPSADLLITGEFIEGTGLFFDGRGSSSYPDELVAFEWDLHYDGDDFTVELEGEIVDFTYMDDGNYTVAFRVTDDDGSQDVLERSFDIGDRGPAAAITVDRFLHPEGKLIVFSAGSSSSFPDELVAYHWDWETDGVVDVTTTEVNERHAFTMPGAYEVSLTVEDDDGTTHTVSVNITITDVGPEARLDAQPTPEGQPVLLNASGSTEPGRDFAAFRWDLDNDGEWDVEETCSTLEWVWTNPGLYTITVQVEDVDGSRDSKTAAMRIDDVVPVADAGGPYEVEEGTPLILSAAGSTEPGQDFVVFKWDMDGDGRWDVEGAEADVEWTYDIAKDYTVKLYVEDADGSSDTATVGVRVIGLDPVFDVVLPSDVKEGLPATFALENMADPGTEEFNVTWHFGDGQSGSGVTVDHTFAEQGSYSGRVVVIDNDGNVVDAAWASPLQVANSPPVVELSDMTLKATEDSWFKVSVFGEDTPNDTVSYDFKGPGGKIDPATGLFKWMPADEHAGKRNKFTFYATDEDGGTGELEVFIDVEDVDNDFLGMSTAAGVSLIVVIILVAIIALLLVARQRGLIGKGGDEDDVIEPEAKVDMGEVEVDLPEEAGEAPEEPPAQPPAGPAAEAPEEEAPPKRPKTHKKVVKRRKQ